MFIFVYTKDLSEACSMANGSLSANHDDMHKESDAFQALKDACLDCSGCLEEECTTAKGGDDGEAELADIVQQSLVMAPKFKDKSHNQMVLNSKKATFNAVHFKLKQVKKNQKRM